MKWKHWGLWEFCNHNSAHLGSGCTTFLCVSRQKCPAGPDMTNRLEAAIS